MKQEQVLKLVMFYMQSTILMITVLYWLLQTIDYQVSLHISKMGCIMKKIFKTILE